MLVYACLVLLGYLLGSVASAIIVARLRGAGDPRFEGSGNPGATNVLRLHGRLAAGLTLGGDLVKGLVPVLVARWLDAPPAVIMLTGAAAFAGHLFPVYFRFRGGKGVATLIGVLLGTQPLFGFAFIATWLGMAALFRYSSLAAVTAAALTPLYVWLLEPEPAYVIGFGLLAMLLIWRHHSNIRKLLNGTEEQFGAR